MPAQRPTIATPRVSEEVMQGSRPMTMQEHSWTMQTVPAGLVWEA